ncbi:MAG: YraN family protein [Candidatus Aminicenantes bacterium]|nr:MAG: YraN family protein [Candidatus Aminicenantes bacterium]
MLSPHKLGILGEEIAKNYLEKKKFRIIQKGFRLYKGEIDLVAYDRETLVFVEVKTRNPGMLGLPEESVNIRKQRQIQKIAEGYLALNNLDEVESRFDVISVVFDEKGTHSITHYKDAF